MGKGAAAAFFLAATAIYGQGGPCSSPVQLSPTTVTRSSPFRVTIKPAPKATQGTITLARQNVLSKPENIALDDSGTVSYTVPGDFALGQYTVSLTLGGSSYPACDLLNIVPAPGWQLTLLKFDPPGTSETTNGRVKLTLRGSGFKTGRPQDNQIYINDQPIEVTWAACDDQQKETVFGQVVSGERIDLCHVPAKTGEMAVRINQGNLPALTTDPQPFRIYEFSYSKWTVGIASFVVALVLALAVLGLVKLLLKKQVSSTQGVLATMFLDSETDTYSLSKFQFYWWTAAALFGYSYLVISKMIVQNLAWPDIPNGLPAIIAIGAGTSVGAQFVTNVRGPKGSGAETPSLGDLVTSGGVAAPERVQFFVWTILGVAAFCLSVLKHSPENIQALDPVPDGMLTMMGLSSAGYLGGKLARKPGPIVNEISITPAESDDAIAAAAAAPQAPPNLSQPGTQAKGVLDTLSNITSGNAKVAVDALGSAVTAVSQVKTASQGQDVLTKLAEQQRTAEAAATAAAAEFATPGSQPATAQAAEAAQRAAAALQDLSNSATSLVAASVGPRAPGMGLPFTRVIELRGQNISSEGLFEINGSELPFRMLVEKDGQRNPEVVIREQDNPAFARVLRLSIDPGQLEAADYKSYKEWFGVTDPTKQKTFSVINPDGQKSDITFTMPPSAAQSPSKTGQAAPSGAGKDQK